MTYIPFVHAGLDLETAIRVDVRLEVVERQDTLCSACSACEGVDHIVQSLYCGVDDVPVELLSWRGKGGRGVRGREDARKGRERKGEWGGGVCLT